MLLIKRQFSFKWRVISLRFGFMIFFRKNITSFKLLLFLGLIRLLDPAIKKYDRVTRRKLVLLKNIFAPGSDVEQAHIYRRTMIFSHHYKQSLKK